MAKFETVETMMYQYLCDELIEDITLANKRIDILTKSGDLDLARMEEVYVADKKDQLHTLELYLELSEKSTTNRPHYIEISNFSVFGDKKPVDELNSYQLDNESYYLKDSGINLGDWKMLDSTKLYIIGNLTFRRVDDELLTRYPHETVWYPMSLEDEYLLDKKDEKFYIKED